MLPRCTPFLLLAVTGCATSHASESRQNLAAPDYVIEKLVVVGFSEDASLRESFERSFADRLSALGLETDTSYPIMPSVHDLDDDDTLETAESRTGADTSALIEVIESNETAAAAEGVLFGAYIAGLLVGDGDLRRVGTYGGLAAANAAGDWKLRITLWNMADNSLLWSLDTDSYMQGSADSEAANLAEFLHGELTKDGLVR